MSMLAEPRQRQRWSTDPQNIAWSQDKSRFGYQLMKKMGWSDGKGLGVQENGDVDHVKIKKKEDNLGVGAKKSYDDVWLAHQDDFSAILSSLNSLNGEKEKSANKVASLESAVKKSRKKIMYSKFIKSKDLSRASEVDMVGIFGPKSKSCPASPQVLIETDDEGNKSDGAATGPGLGVMTNSHGFTTISSGCSMQDYFAMKVKALKEKTLTVTAPPEADLQSERMSVDLEGREQTVDRDNSAGKKKKRRKKEKVRSESKGTADSKPLEETELVSSHTENLGANAVLNCAIDKETSIAESRRKKKKKKKKRDHCDLEFDTEDKSKMVTAESVTMSTSAGGFIMKEVLNEGQTVNNNDNEGTILPPRKKRKKTDKVKLEFLKEKCALPQIDEYPDIKSVKKKKKKERSKGE